MNLDSVFKRFFQDWQKFAWMGFGAFLVQVVAGSVATILAIALIGPTIFSLVRADYLGYDLDMVRTVGMIGTMGVVGLLAAVVGILGSGLANAGLVGSVVAYRRGEEVSLSTFWSCATRYFGRMILLGVILVGILLLSLVLLLIPVLGWIALFIWIPTATVTLALYPSYLIINEDYGVAAAVGMGFRILTSQIGEALLGGAILLGFGIVLGVIGAVPFVGWIVVGIFGTPLLLFFFTERFETEVRPRLSP